MGPRVARIVGNEPQVQVTFTMSTRTGFTLLELVVVITIAAIVCALALPRLWGIVDHTAARGAATDIAAAFGEAREQAITRRQPVAVILDTTVGRVVVRARGTQLLERDVGAGYGVRLWASRDSMAYDPRGLGFGAANLTVVVRRGRAAESVSVSRLGRVRR